MLTGCSNLLPRRLAGRFPGRGAHCGKASLLPIGLAILAATATATAADWPTYQGDNARSAVSAETITPPLRQLWIFQSPHPPQPAWQGEAKRDPYNKVYNLKNRQLFDHAFYVAAVQDRVLFGSSADDKVYCLDHGTGEVVWNFYTEGPVRLAPSVAGDRVYFGSDDGHVYCLDLKDGSLIWKTRLGPRDYRIPGNGRIISAWPVRTGVVVQGDRLYACAGMFPSQGVFLCALDRDTGRITWKQEQNDLPAQGYLLASATRLYVPSGRNNPVVCDLNDGRRLRVVSGSGGTYALLTGDTLVFGPGKTGQLGLVEAAQKDQLASFAGNHMIIDGEFSYLHTDTELSALHRTRYLELVRERKTATGQLDQLKNKLKQLEKQKAPETSSRPVKSRMVELGQRIDRLNKAMQDCFLWRIPCDLPWSLILSQGTLWAGGDDKVAAFAVKDGSLLWEQKVTGRAYGLAAARRQLYVSTDQGAIHCLAPAASKPGSTALLNP